MASDPIRDPKADRLLTPQNAAFIIIDYQPVQVNSIASIDRQLLLNNIVGCAKAAVAYGLPVMHGDADTDLQHYPDGAFDYVVLSRTLQAVERPRAVLAQMLRIGTRAVVSFPNFGHWLVRWQLLSTGRMPMTSTWDRPWHETPNIHPCTIRDFFALCAEEGYQVETWLAVDDAGRRAPWRRFPGLANLFGEQGLFVLRRL